ncbi:unnamed protein product [Caenorhabditis nigoni]
MVGHICEVFCSSINGIDIVEQSLIEWIIKFQPTIPHVWIMKGVITSSESLDHTLKNLKVTEHLGLQSTAIDERFEITNPISSRFITIDGSNWITLPSILNGNNSIIVLNDSMLTPMDINTILKEWQTGSKLQNLEYMRIHTTTLLDADSYIEEAVKDLDFTDDIGNDGRPTTVERDDGRTQTLPETDMGPNAVHYLVLHDNGNCIEDIQQMVEHICEVFSSPIDFIVIFEESLIEWIIQFQPTIRCVWIRKDVISSVKTLDRIFKSLNVTESFGLGPLLTDEAFQITEPIPSRCISFWDSYWLTLPSILNGTNSHIFLYDSNLTAKDINTILMEWHVGTKLRNLEFLKIEYVALHDRDSYTEILEDLDFTDDVGYDGRPTTLKIDDDWIITPTVKKSKPRKRLPRPKQLTNRNKLEKESKVQFPILKLPRVVLLECIENLDVLEIIIFSLLSKRAKSMAKLIHWNLLDITFGHDDKDPYILLTLSSHPGHTWIIRYKGFYEGEEESPEYPYFESYLTGPKAKHYLFLKNNGNAIEGMKKMVEHICEVFRSSICGIYIAEESQIDWLVKFQPEVRHVYIKNNVVTSVETLDNVFKNIKVTEHFVLGSIGTEKETRITESIPYRSVTIWCSCWVTLPAVLNGSNSIIRLIDSKLTPKDINTILREWQMGTKLQNLEYLEIEIFTTQDLESLSNEAVKDLNLTESDGNDGRPRTVVVLLECIENLDVLEVIIFSLLSKRAKSITKLINWTPLNIHLLFGGDTIQIHLKVSNGTGQNWDIAYANDEKQLEYLHFQSLLTVPTAYQYLFLEDNENTIENSKQMAEHICEVFRSTIGGINIGEESQIDWIIRFQPTIRHVSIKHSVSISAKTLDRVLNSLKVTEYLGVGSIANTENFQITEPIKSRSVDIYNSYWLALPSILNGTNSIIRLYDSTLTAKDVNAILKEWQMGSKLRNLEYLAIEFFPLQDHSELFGDLNFTDEELNDGPTTVKIDDDWIITLPWVYSGFNLIRSDGMIGSIVELKRERFPLLKLPKLVLLECIEHLDLLEVTLFSLLSKRTKSIAKLICWSCLDISFHHDKNPYIWISLSSDPGRSWIIRYDTLNEEEEESTEYPCFESNLTGPKVTHNLFLKNDGNAIEDMKQMVEHISEVFRSSISSINIVEQSLIDWIIQFQPEVRYACINDNVITSVETLNRVLKSFKVTEHFVLGSIATDKSAKITEPIPYRSISIWSSYWVTLPAILNGNNSIIRLLDSKLTPKDINTILKEWQMGTKLRNLEYLEIEIFTTQDLEIVSNEAVMNLNLTESDGNDGRPKTGRVYDDYLSTLPSPGPQAFHSLFLKDNGNVIEDVKQMMEHICEVFRSPISDIRIFEESFIEWIIQFQPTIQCVWIRKDVITSVETMERMLKNITMTEFFGLQPTEIDKKFQLTEPIPSRSIAIYNSFWITLPSILNGNNSIIRLIDSNLTAKDINTILKEWQKGTKLQNLEYMHTWRDVAKIGFFPISQTIFMCEYMEIETPKIDTFARPDYHNEILKDLNLTLPQLVLLECIENLDVLEIIIFSLLSERAKSVAKLNAKRSPLNINFRLGGDPKISLRLPTDPGHQWIICYHQTKELEGPIFESKLHGPSVNHYFILKDNGNVIEDSKQVVEHICEVFSSPIRELTITEESLIEWFIKFQPTIQNVWINKHVRISAESLNRIFKSLKVTNHFQLKSIPTDEEIKITERISCPYISIHNSYWSTVPLILNGNNSIIRLYDSNLTPKNINFILRQWQLGFKLQNLEYLEIETVTLLDIDSCIREIWKSLYRKANFGTDGRPVTVNVNDEHVLTVSQEDFAHDIIRSDGMIGSVFGSCETYENMKTTQIHLHLLVWRRSGSHTTPFNFVHD